MTSEKPLMTNQELLAQIQRLSVNSDMQLRRLLHDNLPILVTALERLERAEKLLRDTKAEIGGCGTVAAGRIAEYFERGEQ